MRRDREDGRDDDRSSEHYGQGQSGYGAGRAGDDRALQSTTENRNQGYGGGDDRGRFAGTDDRFSGRGGQGYWQDRGGNDRGWQDRHERSSHGVGREGYGPQPEGLGQRGTYNSGYNQGGQGGQGGYQGQQGGFGGYGTDDRHGSRGPHRGKGPVGYQRSDERIRETVCEVLTDDEHVDASAIEVSVADGEVTLLGMVPDRQTKRRAEDVVERLAAVRDVHNQLKIQSERDPRQSSQTDKKHRA